jgi:hypothetical protein
VKLVLREKQSGRKIIGRVMCDLLLLFGFLEVFQEGEGNAMNCMEDYF